MMNPSTTTDRMLYLASCARHSHDADELRSLLAEAEVLFAAAWCGLTQEVCRAQSENRTLYDDWVGQVEAMRQKGDHYLLETLAERVMDATPVGMAFNALVAITSRRAASRPPRHTQ